MRKLLIIPGIVMLCLVLILSVLGLETVSAEGWEKPVYAYGDGLSAEEMIATAEGLGYDIADLELLILHVADMGKYIDVHDIGEMYSSAILVKQEKGFGVEVRIENPEMITEVTKGEYENAMITAGVVDMLVLVDSPITATGHSALTGIYKAYDTRGHELDEDRMKIAQDELVVTSGIVQEHQYNEDFDADRFNNSMRGMKINIGKEKKDKVTDEVVDKVVTDAIKEEKLEKVLTEYNVQELLDLIMRYSQTSAMDDESVIDQLKQDYDGDIDEGIIDKIIKLITEFLSSIFGSNED